jgi:hypothetical protein
MRPIHTQHVSGRTDCRRRSAASRARSLRSSPPATLDPTDRPRDLATMAGKPGFPAPPATCDSATERQLPEPTHRVHRAPERIAVNVRVALRRPDVAMSKCSADEQEVAGRTMEQCREGVAKRMHRQLPLGGRSRQPKREAMLGRLRHSMLRDAISRTRRWPRASTSCSPPSRRSEGMTALTVERARATR